jgi:hypothetical protein
LHKNNLGGKKTNKQKHLRKKKYMKKKKKAYNRNNNKNTPINKTKKPDKWIKQKEKTK